MSSLTIGSDPTEGRRLGRRAQLLAATSVSYNLIKAVIAITAGTLAGSVALVGFGLDSVVEVSSGLVILWQFRHPLPESASGSRCESSQARSSPWPLCHGESVRALAGGAEPDASPLGIGLARVSLAVMPFLSWAQWRTGRQLGSNAVVADGTPYPAVHLPVGGAALRTDPQRQLGWSWADPIAGLAIAAVAFKEGIGAWRGRGCCAPSLGPVAHAGTQRGPSCADRSARRLMLRSGTSRRLLESRRHRSDRRVGVIRDPAHQHLSTSWSSSLHRLHHVQKLYVSDTVRARCLSAARLRRPSAGAPRPARRRRTRAADAP